MKNQIRRVKVLGDIYLQDSYIAKIDGVKIQSKEVFFQEMEKAFCLPSCHNNWDAYEDWMTDLEWISERKIVLVIYNFSLLLNKDEYTKEIVVKSLRDGILPFWEEEVKHVVVGEKPKEFQVYLVD